MIAEKLKKSILQAAIQGKLTEQLPEDGDARDLLKEIHKGRKLPRIDDDEAFFDIPENWCWVRLGEILDVKGGKRIPVGKKLTKTNTGYRYVRVADMHNETILDTDVHYVPNDVYPLIKNYTISSEDVYITVAGSIGRVGTIPQDFDGANLTENADKLVFKKINKHWLTYTLQSPFVLSQIIESTTKVGQPKLAIKRIENFIVPFTPLSEQERIVERLEDIFSEIDKLKNDETKLNALQKSFPKKMKDSILQYAIQGKLTEQLPEDGNAKDLLKDIKKEKSCLIKEGKIKKEKPISEISEEEIPFDIPGNWCWVRLGEIITLKSGQDMTPDKYNSSNSGIPYITGASNFSNGSITVDRWTETPQSVANKGDLLITCKGTVGEMAFLSEEKAHIARQVMAIKEFGRIDIQFILIFLKWHVSDLKSMAKSMIPGISRDMVLSSIIPLPPYLEQIRIVQRLEEILPLCETLE